MPERICPFDKGRLRPVKNADGYLAVRKEHAGVLEGFASTAKPDAYVCEQCGFLAYFIAQDKLAKVLEPK